MLEKVSELAEEALRVLGMAYKVVPGDKASLEPADMEGLPQVLASNLAFLREVGCRLIDRRRPRRD